MKSKIPLLSVLLFCSVSPLQADDGRGWFIRPYLGFSHIQDQSPNTQGVGSIDATAEVDLDNGFVAGLGVGYRYNAHWASEIAWEYRSNDSMATLADGQDFPDGNYASNIFNINGFYYFTPMQKWQPYIGGGLSWVQEIDLDLEDGGIEQSYSGDGDIGYQIFTGVAYRLIDHLSLHGELRYGSISGINLNKEPDDGSRIKDLDYEPATLQLGLSYQF